MFCKIGKCGRSAGSYKYLFSKHSSPFCSKSSNEYDVIVSGGGIVGSAMVNALSNHSSFEGKRICLLEGRPQKSLNHQPNILSNQTCTLSPASKKFLEDVGAWDYIENTRVQPVKRMLVWESCSDAMITFQNENMNDEIAFLAENQIIQTGLDLQLQNTSENVDIRYNTKIQQYNLPTTPLNDDVPGDTGWAEVELENGEILQTKLIIGADGFKSKLRDAAKINVIQKEYDQCGIVAVVKFTEPTENNVAWQRFLPTGPIALLPMDEYHSSLVWSTNKDEATKLLELHEEDFTDAINNALWSDSHYNSVVGEVTQFVDNVLLTLGLDGSDSQQLPPTVLNIQPGSRASFPLGLTHATHYVKQRTALIGDSAHRIHPLAGLGANLGLGDVVSLRDTLVKAIENGADLGSLTYLLEYEKERQKHNVPIMFGVDGLFNLYNTTSMPIVMCRSIGLQLSNAIPPIKEFFRQKAMNC